MRPLCVIPARAGSKRLPGKNLARLAGRPMLAYTIEAARDSGVFDAVYVSTESPAIAEAAERHGAQVPGLRPPELAGDTVTNVAVSLHLLDEMARRGERFDCIYCLQPSSPLRSGRHIREAWQIFAGADKDFLASVTAIDPHDFHWALTQDEQDWRMFFGDRFMTVRQNLPPVFRPNGAIKLARAEALRRQQNFFGPRLAVYEMPFEASVHVATAFDLRLCETILAPVAV